jgi:predicted DNA-binding transcriptional regulator AlpA
MSEATVEPLCLSESEVLKMVPVSRTQLRRLQDPKRDDPFPTPILLGGRIFYRREEVVAWVSRRPRRKWASKDLVPQ